MNGSLIFAIGVGELVMAIEIVNCGSVAKGILRKEDQQYGDWLQADAVRATRKIVAVISGTSHTQAPWMK